MVRLAKFKNVLVSDSPKLMLDKFSRYTVWVAIHIECNDVYVRNYNVVQCLHTCTCLSNAQQHVLV